MKIGRANSSFDDVEKQSDVLKKLVFPSPVWKGVSLLPPTVDFWIYLNIFSDMFKKKLCLQC